MGAVKIGLCGFTIAIRDYSRWFPVVEIQHTFYQPPADGVMQRWRANTPADMEFTIKAWQLVTHTGTSPTYRRLKRPLTPRQRGQVGAFRKTAIVDEGWRVTARCATLLNASAILFQCPASFKPTDKNVRNMESFFAAIDRPPAVRLLWEPRGTWPDDLVKSLCAACRLIHVVDPFVNARLTPGVAYYRLHGVTGSRHVYSDEELRRLRDMVAGAGEAYVLFNNIPRADDARRFGKLLGGGLRPSTREAH